MIWTMVHEKTFTGQYMHLKNSDWNVFLHILKNSSAFIKETKNKTVLEYISLDIGDVIALGLGVSSYKIKKELLDKNIRKLTIRKEKSVRNEYTNELEPVYSFETEVYE